jgi:hypothetical protein
VFSKPSSQLSTSSESPSPLPNQPHQKRQKKATQRHQHTQPSPSAPLTFPVPRSPTHTASPTGFRLGSNDNSVISIHHLRELNAIPVRNNLISSLAADRALLPMVFLGTFLLLSLLCVSFSSLFCLFLRQICSSVSVFLFSITLSRPDFLADVG